MEAFTRAPFTLVLLSLCNQLSVNFQEESLIVLLCWRMERAGNGFTRSPARTPLSPRMCHCRQLTVLQNHARLLFQNTI